MRVFPWGAFRMVSSVSFIHTQPLVETTVVKDREATGRLVLDHGRPTSYHHTQMNETGDTILAQSLNRFAVPDLTAGRRGPCRCLLPRPLNLNLFLPLSLITVADATV